MLYTRGVNRRVANGIFSTPSPDLTPRAQIFIQRTAWALGALGVLVLCVFDLGPPLAFNDDWGFAWSARHFNPLRLHIYPASSALALPQIVLGWLVSFTHGDQRLLRLSEILFVLLAMWMLHKLALLAGANRTWSAIAALTPLAFPVFSSDATTFMSDVPYVALLLLAAYAAVHWAEHGGLRWVTLCIVAAILATLQRQIGVGIPLAVTALLWFQPTRHSWRLHDWTGLGLLWAGCLLAVILPTVTGVTPALQGDRIALAMDFQPIYLGYALVFLPCVLGLALVPFLPGLALGFSRSRPKLLVLGLLGLVIADLAATFVYSYFNPPDFSIFPGNLFTKYGFISAVSWYQMGNKPTLFAPPVFFAIEVLSLNTLLLFALRFRDWWPLRRHLPSLALLFLALTQFLPLGLVHHIPYDRYYLPAALLLMPLAARAASRTRLPRLAAGLALLLVTAGIALYVAGEQDLQAWQVARNNATCLAYQYARPDQVYAGYEAMAVYVEVPYYDLHGAILGGVALDTNTVYFSLYGPVNPFLSVRFAPLDDPRPGYAYSSLAPGKLVVVHGVNGTGLPTSAPEPPPACPSLG